MEYSVKRTLKGYKKENGEIKPTFYLTIITAIVLAILTFMFTGDYYYSVLVLIILNAINAVGFNILLGYAGIISLGQAAFYGIGAYTAGIISVQFGFEPILSLAIAGVLAYVCASLLGLIALRLQGHYLAMATLGFGMIINILMNEMASLTGGTSGLSGVKPLTILGKITLNSDKEFYIFISIVFVIFLLVLEVFDKSYYGYRLKFIKNSETAAIAYGINAYKTKVMLFSIVAAIMAINGCFYAHFMQFVGPTAFTMKYSVELLAMAVLGGLGSIAGGVIGAVILTLIPELFGFIADYEMLIYGSFLALAIIFFPNGIVGFFRKG